MEKLLKIYVQENEKRWNWYNLYDHKDYSTLEDKVLNEEDLDIVDYETDFDENLRVYSVEEAMELADELCNMDKYEYGHLISYHEAIGCNIFDAIFWYKDSVFYHGMTMEDVAYEYIQDCYGNEDNLLLNYFDYNSFARDLIHDGYTETEYGVIQTY